MATEIIEQFTNDEMGITSFVFKSTLVPGTFGVSLRDDDAEEFVPISNHGFPTLADAVTEAKRVAWVK